MTLSTSKIFNIFEYIILYKGAQHEPLFFIFIHLDLVKLNSIVHDVKKKFIIFDFLGIKLLRQHAIN